MLTSLGSNLQQVLDLVLVAIFLLNICSPGIFRSSTITQTLKSTLLPLVKAGKPFPSQPRDSRLKSSIGSFSSGEAVGHLRLSPTSKRAPLLSHRTGDEKLVFTKIYDFGRAVARACLLERPGQSRTGWMVGDLVSDNHLVSLAEEITGA